MAQVFGQSRALFAALALAGAGFPDASGADWPMWRFDANRSAASPGELPTGLQRQWTRVCSPREQVWDDPLNHDLMPYDRAFEPVVKDGRMFVVFNDSDKLVALSARDGAEHWRFYSDGPVRLPPVAWGDRVYFVSDDGFLYCLGAKDGEELWKFRGGPSAQKVLGNRRVISAWPCRGGPVIRDGAVYFAASIWPFMGTFIYSVNAETGDVQWVNDGTGAQFIKQPHSAPSFAGVAPQGALVATEHFLLVPGGRSVPAAFDRATGEFRYFHINAGGKGNGGSFVAANEREFFVHTRGRGVRAFDLPSGAKKSDQFQEPVLARDRIYTAAEASHRRTLLAAAQVHSSRAGMDLKNAETDLASAEGAAARKLAEQRVVRAEERLVSAERAEAQALAAWDAGWQGPVVQVFDLAHKFLREFKIDGRGDLILAGRRLYAAAGRKIVSVDLDSGEDAASWSAEVEGEVVRLLAASDRLFAVTLDGRIHCLGAEDREYATMSWESEYEPGTPEPIPAALESFRDSKGRAFFFGVDSADILRACIRHTDLRLDVVHESKAVVSQLRAAFDVEAGVYGKRVAVHEGTPLDFKAPPYVAWLVHVGPGVAAELGNEATLRAVYRSVRPYGGLLWVECETGQTATLAASIGKAGLANAEIEAGSGWIAIRRVGALSGAADWTHLYGNVANTVKSDDSVVKAPLGLLWFGGNSNLDVLPRHGHGPSEQVVGGRLFIEGMNSLSARDVYTGDVLWKREFADLGNYGVYYNETYKDTPLSTAYNQRHIPGANGRGPNYVATEDTVYLAISNACHAIDARSGRTSRIIELPRKTGEKSVRHWGYIGVYRDTLLGGDGFAHFTRQYSDASLKDGGAKNPFHPEEEKGPDYAPIEDLSASKALAAFDRTSGRQLWRVDARHSFMHNGIVAGNGRVYCLDRLPGSAEAKRKRRGLPPPDDYRIVALDARDGGVVWEVAGGAFGSWLGYSEEHDLLLHAGARASDRSRDEVGQGMTVLVGATGAVKWTKPELDYTGPCILHNELILTGANSYRESAGAFSLLDGSPHLIENPLTGDLEPWKLTRAYGCNTVVASEHLLTFRSGAAGYYDLSSHSGTGNLGGFKSGCTSNLIIANGVLNAPDYTRTCSCAYQNQTSLALVHMPEMEMWTYSRIGSDTESGVRLKRMGVNFGAPGDRRSDEGSLWLEHPRVGGDSPAVAITVEGDRVRYFRRHSSVISGDGLPWVGASGVEGASRITIAPRTVGSSGSGDHGELVFPTINASDTAEEKLSGGVGIGSSDLELVRDREDQVIGVRFPKLDLPANAEVESAVIQFTVDEATAGAARLLIAIEDSAAAQPFRERDRDVSRRADFADAIEWKPKAWSRVDAAGGEQRTPNLAGMLERALCRKDWKAGNAVAFLISGDGKRVARSRGKGAPRLVIKLRNSSSGVKPPEPSPYHVRLHFAEPEALVSGERVFDIALQGQLRIEGFDICRDSGAAKRGLVREFRDVPVADALVIELRKSTPRSADPVLSGVELIAAE